jgi:hypothetical protein
MKKEQDNKNTTVKVVSQNVLLHKLCVKPRVVYGRELGFAEPDLYTKGDNI